MSIQIRDYIRALQAERKLEKVRCNTVTETRRVVDRDLRWAVKHLLKSRLEGDSREERIRYSAALMALAHCAATLGVISERQFKALNKLAHPLPLSYVMQQRAKKASAA